MPSKPDWVDKRTLLYSIVIVLYYISRRCVKYVVPNLHIKHPGDVHKGGDSFSLDESAPTGIK